MNGLDVIGDIRGNVDPLERLLETVGYVEEDPSMGRLRGLTPYDQTSSKPRS